MFTLGSWNVVFGWTGPGTCMTRLEPDWLIVFGPVPMFDPPEIEKETSEEFASAARYDGVEYPELLQRIVRLGMGARPLSAAG